MGIRPPRRRRRSPGSEVRVGVSGRAPGRWAESGSESGTKVRLGSPGQGCGTESGSGFGKSARRPAAGPAVPGPGSGSAAGSVDGSGSCGCFRGPGAAADSGAGFRESRRVSCSAAVPATGFRGPRPGSVDGSGGHAPEGVFRARTGVCRRPSACAESFPGRKRFPRSMSEGAEIRGPLSRAEAARGVPEVGFPGRGPAAGDFCDGRILRRRIGAIRLRP